MIPLIFILFMLVSGILLKIEGRKKPFEIGRHYGNLFLIGAIYFGLIYGAYKFLHQDEWTDDNLATFLLTVLSLTCLISLVYSLSFIFASRKKTGKLALIVGIFWTLATIGGGIFGYQRIGEMNEGWTRERIEKLRTDCPQDLNPDCYVDYVKKTFKNPEAFNALKSDENRAGEKASMDNYLKSHCLKCDPEAEKAETKEINGLPD